MKKIILHGCILGLFISIVPNLGYGRTNPNAEIVFDRSYDKSNSEYVPKDKKGKKKKKQVNYGAPGEYGNSFNRKHLQMTGVGFLLGMGLPFGTPSTTLNPISFSGLPLVSDASFFYEFQTLDYIALRIEMNYESYSFSDDSGNVLGVDPSMILAPEVRFYMACPFYMGAGPEVQFTMNTYRLSFGMHFGMGYLMRVGIRGAVDFGMRYKVFFTKSSPSWAQESTKGKAEYSDIQFLLAYSIFI